MVAASFLGKLTLSIGLTIGTALFQYVFVSTNVSSPSPAPVFEEDLSNYTDFAQDDFIRSMPGLDFNPSFRQFSGYLTVGQNKDRHIFYWYVESQNSPQTDPLVFWTNGGPGCSGLYGLGVEHGPFFFSRDGKLTPNPYSWNTIANILYVEQPVGVGFSYSEDDAHYTTGDAQAAADNFDLIQEFLDRFPGKRTNPFYISSESYGGHYMPQLTKEILNKNTDGRINFRGMIVGNPYVDPLSNAITQYRSYYSHGLVSKPLYDSFTKACLVESTYSDIQCGMDVHAIYSKMGNGINPYALDYPVCLENGRDSFYDQENAMRRIHSPSSQARQLLASVGPPFLSSEDHYKPCGEQHFTSYLNRDDVRDALHVRDADNVEWLSCSSRVKYSSSDRLASQINQYQDLIDMAVEGKHDLRLAVYSGDDDSICSLAGTQEWIYDLGVEPVASKMWKAWDAGNRQTAGYITEFNMGSQTNASFHLVTVHGAGHEVPTYRPFEALDLFRRYLNGAL